MFKGTFKDIITNIFAVFSGVAGLVQAISLVWAQWIANVSTKPTLFEWMQLVGLIVMTVVAYYTGKSGDGKAKETL